MTQPQTDRPLRLSATVFAMAVLVHNGDHLRRGGDSVSTDVFAVGTLGMVLEVVVIGLVLMGHRLAPLAAATVGASLTGGYLLVHLAPRRTWLSDNLTAGEGVAWFSWVAVIGLIVAAAVLAVSGWLALRRRGGASHDGQPARPAGSVLHPITTAVAIGNAVILMGSVATL